ncbi:hypothetical protein ACODYM_28765 [Burkholderia gladioli]|uniref:hypothetical protein n=1 Tax=Burkholderia gladioli TaxID=28095 RepID=UPI003B4FFE2F
MRKLYIAGIAAASIGAVLLIASCSGRHSDSYDQAATLPQPAPVAAQAPAYVAAQAPVVVQQPPVIVQNGGHDGFLSGMLMGHLLSGGGSHSVVHHYSPAPVRNTTIVNKTVNVTRVAPAPSYRATPSYRSSSSSYSSYRASGSSFGGSSYRSSGYSSFRSSGRR